MTDILFKGKEKYCNDNVWVVGTGFNRQYDSYGNLHMYIGIDVYSEREPKQINVEWIEIVPETLSRFIGIEDKHGIKIFENDIVATQWKQVEEKALVYWDYESCGWRMTTNHETFVGIPDSCQMSPDCCDAYEILGNLFDNPELLGGKE